MSGYASQLQNNQRNTLLASEFRLLYNPIHAWADAISMLYSFPAMTAFYSSKQGSPTADNDLTDLSGNELHLTRASVPMTYAGTDIIASWIQYDGVDDRYFHLDTSKFDIIGTETRVQSTIRGLTLGAWVNFDNAASGIEAVIAKWNTSNRSYRMFRRGTGEARFDVSDDGTTITNVFGSDVIAANTWTFIAGRFTPSTEMAIWTNSAQDTNTTGIPASLFNGTADFELASNNGGANWMDGGIAMPFICEAALPDVFLNSFFQMTAPLFNVEI